MQTRPPRPARGARRAPPRGPPAASGGLQPHLSAPQNRVKVRSLRSLSTLTRLCCAHRSATIFRPPPAASGLSYSFRKEGRFAPLGANQTAPPSGKIAGRWWSVNARQFRRDAPRRTAVETSSKKNGTTQIHIALADGFFR